MLTSNLQPQPEDHWGPISVPDIYPDIDAINVMYPGAQYSRPTIDKYESGLESRGKLTPLVQSAIALARKTQAKYRTIFYVAGPLTGVSEQDKERYVTAAKIIEKMSKESNGGMHGYVPHLSTDPVKNANVTSEEVRDIDFLWATIVPAFHINFLSPMAHGNAIEAGWAERGMIPTIFLNPTENKLSRLTKGLNIKMAEINYMDEEDMKSGLEKELLRLDAWLTKFPGVDPRYYYYMSTGVLRDPAFIASGLDPRLFNPVINVRDLVGYISDPDLNQYGQMVDITAHYWQEEGALYECLFENGDTGQVSPQALTTWFNPTQFN